MTYIWSMEHSYRIHTATTNRKPVHKNWFAVLHRTSSPKIGTIKIFPL